MEGVLVSFWLEVWEGARLARKGRHVKDCHARGKFCKKIPRPMPTAHSIVLHIIEPR